MLGLGSHSLSSPDAARLARPRALALVLAAAPEPQPVRAGGGGGQQEPQPVVVAAAAAAAAEPGARRPRVGDAGGAGPHARDDGGRRRSPSMRTRQSPRAPLTPVALQAALRAFAPRHVRVMRDASRAPYCFVDFPDAAAAAGDGRVRRERTRRGAASPGTSRRRRRRGAPPPRRRPRRAAGGPRRGADARVRAAADAGASATDWLCERCNAVNFARRSRCYQCQDPKPARPRVVGDREGTSLLTAASVSTVREGMYDCAEPTPTLVLYGLSQYSGEAEVAASMRQYAPVRRVELVRDRAGQTRGVAFVHFAGVEPAQHVLRAIAARGGACGVDGARCRAAFTRGLPRGARPTRPASSPSARGAGGGPKWPPPFHGGAGGWRFDAASGSFYEPASGFYFDPKQKVYAAARTGKRFRHAPGRDPPFLELPPAAAPAPAARAPAPAPPAPPPPPPAPAPLVAGPVSISLGAAPAARPARARRPPRPRSRRRTSSRSASTAPARPDPRGGAPLVKTRADGKLVCRVSARMFPDRAALRSRRESARRAAYESAWPRGPDRCWRSRKTVPASGRGHERSHVTVLGLRGGPGPMGETPRVADSSAAGAGRFFHNSVPPSKQNRLQTPEQCATFARSINLSATSRRRPGTTERESRLLNPPPGSTDPERFATRVYWDWR